MNLLNLLISSLFSVKVSVLVQGQHYMPWTAGLRICDVRNNWNFNRAWCICGITVTITIVDYLPTIATCHIILLISHELKTDY